MSKIIGVTVGTPHNTEAIAEKLKPVKTVNGIAPDAKGNVVVKSGAVTSKPGFYVGTDEPTDPDVVLWVNPDGEASSADEKDYERYFEIDADGIVSLKPEYRGALSYPATAYPYAVSDNGLNVAGTKNSELPSVLVIPQNIDGEEVKGFQMGIFCDNRQVKEVTIPKTVKTIPGGFGRGAFNLEKVTNTEQIESIGTAAFCLCGIREAIFPNITSLGNLCFQVASCLIRADLGHITTIPKQAFYNCENLSEVKADKVTSVGQLAFWGTRRLKTLPFLSKVTSLGVNAFWSSRCDLETLPGNCTFDETYLSCYKQWNDTDYWTGVTYEPCKNPLGSLFHQKDPRWANKEVKYTDKNGKLWTYKDENGNTCTFGANGCAFFTLMEIYSAFMGVQFNSPEEFFPIIEAAGMLSVDYRDKEGWCQIANAIGLETELLDTMTSANLKKMYDALKDGELLYKSVMGKTTINGGHAVLAYGINSDGEMLIADTSMHCWEIGIYENHKTAWHVYKQGNKDCDCVIVKKKTNA